MPGKDDAAQPGEAKRVSRGYKLREDLIKALKRLAVDTDKKLYEVMEEAIEEYLERHKPKS
jgi:predicted transcriptional regulator